MRPTRYRGLGVVTPCIFSIEFIRFFVAPRCSHSGRSPIIKPPDSINRRRAGATDVETLRKIGWDFKKMLSCFK